MLFILIPFLIVALFLILITEGATRLTYGGFIPDHEIEAYLNKYLSKTTLNPFDSNIFSDIPQYISKVPFTLSSRWYVDDYGIIPRWSKWSKVLDARHKELLKTHPNSKKLSEL